MPSLDFANAQCREAAERYIADQHPLAELGMGDWFAESFLMEMEQVEERNS